MAVTLHRCHALPIPLAAESVYFVKAPGSKNLAVYVTGTTAEVIYHTVTDTELDAAIADHIEANGRGILTVDRLPAPALVPGQLFCLKGINNPCWSTGTEWVDLAKAKTVNDDGSDLDNTLLKRLRNELQFGIKLV